MFINSIVYVQISAWHKYSILWFLQRTDLNMNKMRSNRIITGCLRVTTLHIKIFISHKTIGILLLRGKLEAPPREALVNRHKTCESPNLGTSEPPVARIPRERRIGSVDRELPVVKPPILAFLEEIRSSIVPLQGRVDSAVKKVLSICTFNNDV